VALIQCRECAREMSDRADSCPACGCPGPTAVTFKAQRMSRANAHINSGSIIMALGVIGGFLLGGFFGSEASVIGWGVALLGLLEMIFGAVSRPQR